MNWANIISAFIVGAILYVVWMELQSIKSRANTLQHRVTFLSDHVARVTTWPVVPGSKPIFFGDKPQFLILESETPLSVEQIRNIKLYLEASGIKALILDKTIKVKTTFTEPCEHEWKRDIYNVDCTAEICGKCKMTRMLKPDDPDVRHAWFHLSHAHRVCTTCGYEVVRPRTMRIPVAGGSEVVLTAEEIARLVCEANMREDVEKALRR